AYRPHRVRGLHLPRQLRTDRDRSAPRGHLHGGVRDPVALRPARRDVALPRRTLRGVRQHVPGLAAAGGCLRRAEPEPRGVRRRSCGCPRLHGGRGSRPRAAHLHGLGGKDREKRA
ncbi:unnamed protein product, partial [Ectocarpus sp. 12 AP-2014]